MKVAVTGGAGFIGSYVVDHLLATGCQVSVLDDFSSGSWHNLSHCADQIEIVEGSILDPLAVRAALAGADGVVHLGAMVSVPLSLKEPVLCAQQNTVGTVMVLEECRRQAIPRFVQASSSAVYGSLPGLPKSEDSPLKPISPYGASKLACESYAESFAAMGVDFATSLRIFNAYGPRQDPGSPYSGVIAIFMNRMAAGESLTVYGDGLNTRDFIYVKDVARSIGLCLQRTEPGHRVYNIASGRSESLLNIILVLSGLAHPQDGSADPQKRMVKVVHAPPRMGDIAHSLADISLVTKELGFTPEWSLKDGLKTTFQDVLRSLGEKGQLP